MKIGIRIEQFKPGAAAKEPRIPLPYSALKDMVQTAESGGFDAFWLADHLLFRRESQVTEGPWEAWTLLSALAEATERIEFGPMVLCTPFRNPALIAKMAHTLDELSAGRLILGLGAGWHKPEFDAFGFPYERRVDQLEEALQIIQPLLKGQSVDFAGTYYQARDCIIIPKSPRPGGIPLMVAAFGPRMMRLAARYADMWNKAWIGDPRELEEPLSQFKEACVEVGRDPDSIAVAINVSVAYPDLGEAKPFAANPLTGPPEHLAQVFQKYAAAGVAYLTIQAEPSTLVAVERIIEAVQLYRSLAQ